MKEVNSKVKLIECPRDAMQGISVFIPTESKVTYINQLMRVGYDTLDCGSFVSPKAIPQMADTAEVLSQIDMSLSNTQLLVIIANVRGALQAAEQEKVTYLGYPFSISETFQMRNTNATIMESLIRVEDIHEICLKKNKKLVLYLSMGFGNPYGDPWNLDIVEEWVDRLNKMGIEIVSLSDTIGVSSRESIEYLFTGLIPKYPDVEFGAHLHTHPDKWYEKVDASFSHGCLRMDSAIKGFGGCPMAKDDLVGNMATENVIQYLIEKGQLPDIDLEAFGKALRLADEIFPK
ncbi:MAG: hydroxymethylglutaryl-CoA lyase [Bacteroidetes bacterium]|jgi:hydroxymethylglutaryl-CoA lyase|nr:hydroxymethylglutaryl-CoA lyase [Bacteroidota bacterium]